MTTPIPRLLPLASTDCGCCAPATPSGTVSAPPVDTTPEPISNYQVSGLTCGSCAGTVTSIIEELPQVTTAHVDLVAGGLSTVTVTGTASPEVVRQVIEQVGYTVAVS